MYDFYFKTESEYTAEVSNTEFMGYLRGKSAVIIFVKHSVSIPRAESNLSAIQIHLSAYQSSLHLSRTSDLRSCLTASLTSEASSDFQQSRGCKTTSVTTLDSFCEKVDSLRGLGGSEKMNQWI